jgi:hypothetical protein
MRRSNRCWNWQAGAILFGLLLLCPASSMAQTPEPAPVVLLSSDQLDDLVAPVALYPDSLLAQVLAASTYPLEIVEAQQWLQQNGGLPVTQLPEAAKQQNWDPSVQALVAFPKVLTLLNRDIRWTTDLGNAFLAQQADVMNAVQRMRSRARANGALATTPEQSVTIETRDDQSAIEIQPANPQVIYVPTYNPTYVWGPPAWGTYPALGYRDTGSGIGFDPGVLISALFSGLLNFSGWGWGLNWLTHALFLNNLFFGHFGFGGSGNVLGAETVWAHNPGHRLGVPYPNRVVAGRFASGRSVAGISNVRFNGARAYNAGSYNSRAYGQGSAAARSVGSREQTSAGGQRFEGSRGSSSNPATGGRTYQSYNRSAAGSRGTVDPNRYNSPVRSYQSPSRSAPQRTTQFASSYRSASPASRAPAQSARYSSPKMPRSSAPRISKPSKSPHIRSPHVSSHSGGHSSGGHSGKHR